MPSLRISGDETSRSKTCGYLILGLTFCGVLGIIFYQKKLRTALKVLRESSQFVSEHPRMILVSLGFTAAFQTVLCFTLLTLGLIVTQKSLVVPESGFYGSIDWDPAMRNQFLLLGFWFIWTWDLLNGLEAVLVSHVCQNWFAKSDRASAWDSFRVTFIYHFGSVVFGSFLSAILESTQLILNTLQEQLRIQGLTKHQQIFQNYLLRCLQCTVNVMQQILRMVNESSYILIAMKGENYITSATEAADIVYSQSSYYLISQGLSKLYSVLGRLLIAILAVLITSTQID